MAGALWQAAFEVLTQTDFTLGAGAALVTSFFSGPLKIRQPGTIDLLTVQCPSSTYVGSSFYELYKNGSGTGYGSSVPGGTWTNDYLTKNFTQGSGSVHVADGDELTVQRSHVGFEPFNTLSTNAIGFRFTADDPTKTVSRLTVNSFAASTHTGVTYIALVGQGTSGLAEVVTQFHPGTGARPGRLQYASVLVNFNNCAAESLVIVRVNFADSILVIRIPAFATGWHHSDDSLYVDLTGNEPVNYKIIPGDASGITMRVHSVDFTTTSGQWTSGLGQQIRGMAGGAVAELCIGGLNALAPGPQRVPFETYLTGLGIFANTAIASGDGLIEFVVDGSTVASKVLPAGETQRYYNLPNILTAHIPTDGLALVRLTAGAGGLQYYCIDFTGQAQAPIPPAPTNCPIEITSTDGGGVCLLPGL